MGKRGAITKAGIIGVGITAAGALIGICAWAWQRFGPATYLRFRTMFGTARVYQVEDDEGSPVRLLEVGGIVQSGTYLDERYADLVFEYLKRYDLMFEHFARHDSERDNSDGCDSECENFDGCDSGREDSDGCDSGREDSARRVAVLGCGGYDYPEHLVAHHPDVICDAVEIDPAITAIARRYFHLDRIIEEYETEKTGRLNLICADALEFLEMTDQRYDAIVNDTFDAGTPPAHLTTPAFFHAVHDRLNPGGLFLTNIVSPLAGPDAAFLHQQVAALQQVFSHVDVHPCAEDDLADADNVIVVAYDD